MANQPAPLEPSEWISLYDEAMQESSPEHIFSAIHRATKAMVGRLRQLDSGEPAKRKIILVALDDLRVLRLAWTSRMAL